MRVRLASCFKRALPLIAFVSLGVRGQPAAEVPSAEVLERDGVRIGEVLIDRQNVFDTNDPKEDKALFRAANALHITTREQVIRQQLLFQSGDLYASRLLEESERILRGARYLYDVSIEPVRYHDGVVDIAVRTRDVWTLNPGISFNRSGGKNGFGFELEDLNVFGSGAAVAASHVSSVDRDSDVLSYKDPHLGQSWLSLSATYADNSDGSTKALSLEQPFYSLDTQLAYGFSGLDDDRVESLYDLGEIVDQFQARNRNATVFAGWSKGLVDNWTRRWSTGLTYDDHQFSAAPGREGSNLIPADRTLAYPWIGIDLIQNDYTKVHNRDQIGRTEDFCLGAQLSARIGWASPAFGSDRNALVFSGSAAYGIGATERSTILLSSSLSGRMEDGALRNTVVNAAARYYLQESPRSLFFATVETSFGTQLDLDNQILLGGDNGLRGYPLRYQSGDSRALLTIEQRYFTDWYPLHLFRVGAAAFADVGRTWGDSPVGTPSRGLLKDVGIGLRIGNSRSGLGNVIHVDLAMPLDGDSSISNVQLLVETKQRF